MALPDQIYDDTGWTDNAHPLNSQVGRIGPYCYSNNVYLVVAFYDGSNYTLSVVKNTNPGTASWSAQDHTNRPTGVSTTATANQQVYYDCVFDGTEIHIAHAVNDNLNSEYTIEYHVFDCSTDTWTTTNETVVNYDGDKQQPGNITSVRPPSIHFRPGVTSDELVIIYFGLSEKDMGTNYERLDFWHKNDSATTWTGPVAVDGATTTQQESDFIASIGENEEGIHVVYGNGSATQYGRTISTTNTLSTKQGTYSPSPGNASGGLANHQATVFDRVTGNDRLVISQGRSATDNLENWYVDISSNVLTATEGEVGSRGITATAPPNTEGLFAVADNTNNRLYSAAVKGTEGNLFLDYTDNLSSFTTISADYSGSVQAEWARAEVFDRGGGRYLGIVYGSGSSQQYDWYYNEYTISSGIEALTLSLGSYTKTGQTTDLLKTSVLTHNAGSYTQTGQTLDVTKIKTLDLVAGSYTYTGLDGTLLKTNLLTHNLGSYDVTGLGQGLNRTYPLNLVDGSYAYSGLDGTLLWNQVLTHNLGSYTINGQTVDLLRDLTLETSLGNYTKTGNTLDLTFVPGGPEALTLELGTYTLTGNSLYLHEPLTLTAGSYAVNGQTTDLLKTSVLTHDAGEYELADTFPRVRTTWTSAHQSQPFVVTKPAEVQENDLLIFYLALNNANADDVVTPPSGWTELLDLDAGTANNAVNGYVAWKRAGASEPSSYSFSYASSYQTVGRLYVVRNAGNPADFATAVPFGYTQYSTGADPHDPPAVSYDSTDPSQTGLAIALDLRDTYLQDTVSYPAGYIDIGELPSGTGGSRCKIAWGHKYFTGSSENPGAFDLDGNSTGFATTTLVNPVVDIHKLTLARTYPLNLTAGSYGITGYDLTLTEVVNLTLDLLPGSYAINGQTVDLLKTNVLTHNAGSYSVTGNGLDLGYATVLDLTAGSYNLTGQTVDLLRDLTLNLDLGTYNQTGYNVELNISEVPLDLIAGSYTVNGQATDLLKTNVIDLVAGSYTVNGQTVDLVFSYGLQPDAGSYAVNGQTVDLLRDLTLVTSLGSYALTGQTLDLTLSTGALDLLTGNYSVTGLGQGLNRTYPLNLVAGSYTYTGLAQGVYIVRNLDLTQGSYGVTGYDVVLHQNKVLDLVAGSFTIDGKALDLTATSDALDLLAGSYAVSELGQDLLKTNVLNLTAGSYGVTGYGLDLGYRTSLDLDPGSYAVTEQDLSLYANRTLDLVAGSYTLTGIDGELLVYSVLDLVAGTYGITGYDITLTEIQGLTLDLLPGTYTQTGQDGSLDWNRLLTHSAGSYTYTGYSVTLGEAVDLDLLAGSYGVTGYDATLLWNRALTHNAGSYGVTGYDLTLNEVETFTLDLLPGSYATTGYALDFTKGADLILLPGSYSVTGNAVDLYEQLVMYADPGSYVLTGNDLTITPSYFYVPGPDYNTNFQRVAIDDRFDRVKIDDIYERAAVDDRSKRRNL